MATTTQELPKIGDAAEMPKSRRGRPAMDLSPIIEKLEDFKTHYFEGMDSEEKDKWARKVREAAAEANLSVRTTYSPEESRLYFAGQPFQEKAPRKSRKTSEESEAEVKSSKGKK